MFRCFSLFLIIIMLVIITKSYFEGATPNKETKPILKVLFYSSMALFTIVIIWIGVVAIIPITT